MWRSWFQHYIINCEFCCCIVGGWNYNASSYIHWHVLFLCRNNIQWKKNRNGINELMPCLANNVIIFRNNSTNPLSINVGPFLPFHPLHFLLSHSFQLVPKMKKIIIYTRKLVLGKMNGGMNKKEACIVK
jgi:hypothetical protein